MPAHAPPAPPAVAPPAAAFAAVDEDIAASRLAVIIGWLGAKDRTLQKYADWYREAGWTPLVFTFPASSCLTLARAEARRAACAASILAAYDAAADRGGGGGGGAPTTKPTILMHSFSNTGWLAYCGLLGDLASSRPAALASIKGAVIDSAPFPAMSPEVWAAGFLTAAGGGKKKKKKATAKKGGGRSAQVVAPADDDDDGTAPSSSATPAIARSTAPDRSSLAFKATAGFFRVWMQGARKRALKAVIAHEAAHAAWPALYIFSEDDHVIPASSVRAAAAAHAARNGGAWPARTVCFTSSEHVAHLRHHRAAYTAALDAFVAGDVLGARPPVPAAAAAPVAAPAVTVVKTAASAPLPTTALSRSLSRSLSFKLDPAAAATAAAALARSSSIKAAGGGGANTGLAGLAPLVVGGRGLTRMGSIAAAGGGRGGGGGGGSAVASPTAAMVASLRASLPQLM